jgi:hypothetical protein
VRLIIIRRILNIVYALPLLLTVLIVSSGYNYGGALPPQTGNCEKTTVPTNPDVFNENTTGINIEEGLNPESEPYEEKIPGSEPDPCVGGQPNEPPIQITGLTISRTTSTSISLVWNSNSDPDFSHYNVYRGSNSGFNIIPGVTAPVSSSTVNSFTDSGLKPSTTYYYKIAAVELVGTYSDGTMGPLSPEIVAKTTLTSQDLLGGSVGPLPKNFNPQIGK